MLTLALNVSKCVFLTQFQPAIYIRKVVAKRKDYAKSRSINQDGNQRQEAIVH